MSNTALFFVLWDRIKNASPPPIWSPPDIARYIVLCIGIKIMFMQGHVLGPNVCIHNQCMEKSMLCEIVILSELLKGIQ